MELTIKSIDVKLICVQAILDTGTVFTDELGVIWQQLGRRLFGCTRASFADV